MSNFADDLCLNILLKDGILFVSGYSHSICKLAHAYFKVRSSCVMFYRLSEYKCRKNYNRRMRMRELVRHFCIETEDEEILELR